MKKIVAIRRPAYNLTAGIQAAAAAARIAGDGAEIVDFPASPDDRIMRLIAGRAGKIGGTDHVPGFVEPNGFGVVTSQSAEVLYAAIFVPKKGMAH